MGSYSKFCRNDVEHCGEKQKEAIDNQQFENFLSWLFKGVSYAFIKEQGSYKALWQITKNSIAKKLKSFILID